MKTNTKTNSQFVEIKGQENLYHKTSIVARYLTTRSEQKHYHRRQHIAGLTKSKNIFLFKR